ncbi:peptidoglycan DD-metalloendopeptidase family protein [Luteimonas sp. S4-F44]|uniref:peptidoglycan DD-metalloendopeptidase family protein n=1 Tax=Luteimonas sp. S4-F44 TaxID=2925842 RepID=UPI001F52D8FA|nr:peptidoglycan DD-metalloendopeptidase family protein [Luteimonas sp. S4-F44]UNK41388.1 peptidoglycan DD-metalloendopeptidase family protein [Luteimonas sp. S4-F44]
MAGLADGRSGRSRTGLDGVSPMRIVVLVLTALLLVGCGSSRVVREGGATRTSTPKPGQSVVVQRGDTLYRIASGNGISVLDLATWNSIRPPYTIYPGQRLRLYPGGRGASAAASSGGTRQPVRPTQSAPQPPAPPPARSPFQWQWPTDGQLIARYVANEPTKQGIDIAGTGGQPVRASADGVVVYSGSGLVGYGELIIVKHDEQWLSAYGHNRTRRVNEGERVRAGQQIAEMGRSGAARDMLHFEIRYNGKPVDPLSYLPAR